MENTEIENFIEVEDYPLSNYELTTTPNDFNILTLITFIESKVFKIPTFQRNYVWDIKRASKLIESLLIGLPIPQIFLYEKGKNEYLVIDGQQRLMTLFYFFKGRFPRKEKRTELRLIFDKFGTIPAEIFANDEYFQKFNLSLKGLTEDKLNKFDGKNYDTLGDAQMSLNLATIRNMIIKPINNDVEGEAMFEIFNRLNTGGINLTSQEIRMSLYQSPFMTSLVELNKNPVWRRLLGNKIEDLRLGDVELILRVMAMAMFSDNYRNSVTGFLNSFSNYAVTFNEKNISDFTTVWSNFMGSCEFLDERDLITGGNRISITLFESLFFAYVQYMYTVPIEESLRYRFTKEKIAALKIDPEFILSSTGKTTSKDNVKNRLKRASEFLFG